MIDDLFKIGDVVQLKSGGPKMTIAATLDHGTYYCKWFAGSKLEDGNFRPDTLTKVEETAKEPKKRE